jgi:hypothetical protein
MPICAPSYNPKCVHIRDIRVEFRDRQLCADVAVQRNAPNRDMQCIRVWNKYVGFRCISLIVYLPLIRWRTIGAVFLNVQTKEAHFDTFDQFECKNRLCSVWKFFGKSERRVSKNTSKFFVIEQTNNQLTLIAFVVWHRLLCRHCTTLEWSLHVFHHSMTAALFAIKMCSLAARYVSIEYNAVNL